MQKEFANTRPHILFFLSSSFSIFFLFTSEYYFPGGANHFVDWAMLIQHGGHGYPEMAQRDIGYPLFLFITGFTFLNSFAVSTLILSFFSACIPILIYNSFGKEYRGMRFLAALATIFSLSPYLFLKMIHHDQLYIALSVTSLFTAIKFYEKPGFRWLLVASITWSAFIFTKPAANLIIAALLLSYIVSDFLNKNLTRRRILFYISFLLIVASSAYAYSRYRESFFEKDAFGNTPSYTGQQIFYNFYVNAPSYGMRIDEMGGPETKKLLFDIKSKVFTVPDSKIQGWLSANNFSKEFIKLVYKDPHVRDNIYNSIITCPEADNFWLLSYLMQDVDAPFLRASEELAWYHPIYFLSYTAANIWRMFLGPPAAHGRLALSCSATQDPTGIYFPSIPGGIFGAISKKNRAELSVSTKFLGAQKFLMHKFSRYWELNFLSFLRISAIFTMFGIIFIKFIPKFVRLVFVTSLLFVLYNDGVTAAFADPMTRYIIPSIPFQLTCGVIGLYALASFANSISGDRFRELIERFFERIADAVPHSAWRISDNVIVALKVINPAVWALAAILWLISYRNFL